MILDDIFSGLSPCDFESAEYFQDFVLADKKKKNQFWVCLSACSPVEMHVDFTHSAKLKGVTTGYSV